MREIITNIHVGSQSDYEQLRSDDAKNWRIVLAAKTYHKKFVGYNGWAAPRESPEYLYAVRDNKLALNIIDANDAKYFPKTMIDYALFFLSRAILDNKEIGVFCNKGKSRAPGILMLWLAAHERLPADHNKAILEMKQLYPAMALSKGMADFIRQNWADYRLPRAKPQTKDFQK